MSKKGLSSTLGSTRSFGTQVERFTEEDFLSGFARDAIWIQICSSLGVSPDQGNTAECGRWRKRKAYDLAGEDGVKGIFTRWKI